MKKIVILGAFSILFTTVSFAQTEQKTTKTEEVQAKNNNAKIEKQEVKSVTPVTALHVKAKPAKIKTVKLKATEPVKQEATIETKKSEK